MLHCMYISRTGKTVVTVHVQSLQELVRNILINIVFWPQPDNFLEKLNICQDNFTDWDLRNCKINLWHMSSVFHRYLTYENGALVLWATYTYTDHVRDIVDMILTRTDVKNKSGFLQRRRCEFSWWIIHIESLIPVSHLYTLFPSWPSDIFPGINFIFCQNTR